MLCLIPTPLSLTGFCSILLTISENETQFPLKTPNRSHAGQNFQKGLGSCAFPYVNRCFSFSIPLLSGTAGDSLGYHRNSAFSTKDRDNDNSSGNCAAEYKGGWWFNSCVTANLNGFYYHGPHKSDHDGVNWRSWKGRNYSAKRAEMKIRPADF